MSSIRQQYQIPPDLAGCHTAVIGDYFIEGHVPMEAITKLFEEKPGVDGIALPRMPSGSPGMPGSKRGVFKIYAISDGIAKEFMSL